MENNKKTHKKSFIQKPNVCMCLLCYYSVLLFCVLCYFCVTHVILQAVRNESDLKAMAVPPKYQKMNTFYKYVRLSDCFLLFIY